jgi:hypothetical protein
MWNMILYLSTFLYAVPLAGEITKTITEFNSLSHTKIPQLNSEQLKKLGKGKVVKIVQNGKSSNGQVEVGKAMAYYVSTVPKAQLWVAFQDPHFQVQERTTEYLYKSNGTDKFDWYGYMDVPWPMSDRHWLVKVWNNHSMAAQTKNRMWEHPWKLIHDGAAICKDLIAEGKVKNVTPEKYDSAIYLPESQGGWAMMDVQDSTLLVYSATATVGGSIPEGLMMKYLLSGLDSFMKDGEKRARDVVPKHYGEGHTPIYGGDGKAISAF